MHIRLYQNSGRNDLLGGGVLRGDGIGGETTRVWGTKRPRMKIEVKRLREKRLGEKRLGSGTTCSPEKNPGRFGPRG